MVRGWRIFFPLELTRHKTPFSMDSFRPSKSRGSCFGIGGLRRGRGNEHFCWYSLGSAAAVASQHNSNNMQEKLYYLKYFKTKLKRERRKKKTIFGEKWKANTAYEVFSRYNSQAGVGWGGRLVKPINTSPRPNDKLRGCPTVLLAAKL